MRFSLVMIRLPFPSMSSLNLPAFVAIQDGHALDRVAVELTFKSPR